MPTTIQSMPYSAFLAHLTESTRPFTISLMYLDGSEKAGTNLCLVLSIQATQESRFLSSLTPSLRNHSPWLLVAFRVIYFDVKNHTGSHSQSRSYRISTTIAEQAATRTKRSSSPSQLPPEFELTYRPVSGLHFGISSMLRTLI